MRRKHMKIIFYIGNYTVTTRYDSRDENKTQTDSKQKVCEGRADLSIEIRWSVPQNTGEIENQ